MSGAFYRLIMNCPATNSFGTLLIRTASRPGTYALQSGWPVPWNRGRRSGRPRARTYATEGTEGRGARPVRPHATSDIGYLTVALSGLSYCFGRLVDQLQAHSAAWVRSVP